MAMEERRETGREKLRRSWLAVAAATLLAVLALGAEINPMFVAAGWMLMLLSLLLSPSLPGDETAVPPPPLAVPPLRDPLDDLAAAYAALDLPVIVLGGDGHVLFQNAAAEKAFDVMQPGAHLSARLRSPGILDMVRETWRRARATRSNIPNVIRRNVCSSCVCRRWSCRDRTARIAAPISP